MTGVAAFANGTKKVARHAKRMADGMGGQGTSDNMLGESCKAEHAIEATVSAPAAGAATGYEQ